MAAIGEIGLAIIRPPESKLNVLSVIVCECPGSEKGPDKFISNSVEDDFNFFFRVLGDGCPLHRIWHSHDFLFLAVFLDNDFRRSMGLVFGDGILSTRARLYSRSWTSILDNGTITIG
jgi:hypothetical protein